MRTLTMSCRLLTVLPVLPVLLAAAPPCLARAPVEVSVTLRDPAALDVSYALPPACAGLTFSNPAIPDQATGPVRSDWTALDACTEVDARGIRPTDASCRVLRVRVPATMRAQDPRVYDRIYPWAQPAGKGIYAHTSAYAVEDTCGAVGWTFAAPGGTVVVDGVASAGSARPVAGADAWFLPTVLIAQPYRQDAPPLLVDANVTPAMRALVETTFAQTRRELGVMLPGLALDGRWMVVNSAVDASLRSDVANNTTVRLTLPAVLTPESGAAARSLIVHETAHLAQRFSQRDVWRDERTAISEGGAELLRMVVMHRLGWATTADLQDEMEAAVNGCLLALGGQAWMAAAQRGRGLTPYQCGLTLHLIGQAAGPDRTGILARLRDYYLAAGGGAAPVDFGRALECGRDAACTPRWLPRVLGTEALHEIVLGASGLPQSPLGGAPAWGLRLTEMFAFRHVAQLMQADCNGDISIYHEPAAARIGPLRNCTTLREDMVIVAAEGRPLFGGGDGLQASIAACRARGATVLGLRDGARITLACNDKVSLPARVFGVDAAAVLASAR